MTMYQPQQNDDMRSDDMRRAVVSAIVWVIVADGLLAVIFYVLGI